MTRMKKAASGKAAQNVDHKLAYRHLRPGSSFFHPKSRSTYHHPANRRLMRHSGLEHSDA